MRIYQHFTEALPEIRRDVVEMGIKIHPKTYQDKNVEKDVNFDTLELQNYIYTVTNPRLEDLSEVTQPWATEEWKERMSGIEGWPVNPGTAWLTRREVWSEFLGANRKFSYTYSARLARRKQVKRVVERIKADPDSRQLFICIWDNADIMNLGGISRVPCSLGYQIQVRKGQLNLTYLQRSADLVTHFTNDVWLAHKLQRYLAMETNYEIGSYTHWIASLHMFRKDGKEVF